MRESGQNKQWTSQMSKCKKNKTLKYVVGCFVGGPREEDTRDLNILDQYSLQFHAFVPLDRCHAIPKQIMGTFVPILFLETVDHEDSILTGQLGKGKLP